MSDTNILSARVFYYMTHSEKVNHCQSNLTRNRLQRHCTRGHLSLSLYCSTALGHHGAFYALLTSTGDMTGNVQLP